MNTLEYETLKEEKIHYSNNFSYNTYLCTIPLDFPSVMPHWHDETEIIYIKKGCGIIRLDLKDIKVSAGSIVIVLPGHIHSIITDTGSNKPLEYENIIFDFKILLSKQGDLIAQKIFEDIICQKINIVTHLTPTDSFYQKAAACIDNNDNLCTDFPFAYSLAIKGNLCIFFYILCSNSIHKEYDKNEFTRKNAVIEKIKIITKYTAENYYNNISIKKMAEICNFSQSHFMKFFKQNMGISYIDYLNDYRLTVASNLLRSSTDSIINIACECGYDNVSYFNRLFKKKYKMSPGQFRKNKI